MGDYSTNSIQLGDVLMFFEDDCGEIEEANGFITMTQGIETALVLTHFGGNEEDDGSEATAALQWWGNEGETQEHQYRSRLQSLLRGGSLTSDSLGELAAAALEDLNRDWVLTGLASEVEILSVELVTPEWVKITEQLTFHDGSSATYSVEGGAR